MKIGTLDFFPVLDNKELVPECIYKFVCGWKGAVNKDTFLVAKIDPSYAGGHELCEKYDITPEIGVNCLVVEGKRAQQKEIAVCLVPVGYKYNINSVIRKAMKMRTVSAASLDMVLEISGMEYGSITPIGLPIEWQIYVDTMIMKQERIIIGGGYVNSKLSILTKTFLDMPNVVILDGVARK